MKTTLYRLFDRNGALLYVGISGRWFRRMHEHAGTQGWWDNVAMVKRQSFETRDAALAVEAQAIRDENPQYNQRGRAPQKSLALPRIPPVVRVRVTRTARTKAERTILDEEVAQLRSEGLTGIEIRQRLGIGRETLASSIRRVVAAGRASPLPVGGAALPPEWRQRGNWKAWRELKAKQFKEARHD